MGLARAIERNRQRQYELRVQQDQQRDQIIAQYEAQIITEDASRAILIERIITAARPAVPNVVPSLSGSGFCILASNGTYVGTREATAEAVYARSKAYADKNEADFRVQLEAMHPSRLAAQAAYWLKVQS